jgi:GNAT superfamily N-acetyltransferase
VDLNQLWVDVVPAGTTAARLAAEADLVQADLAHRQIFVADEAGGERLAPGIAELGWSAEALLVMAARNTPAEPEPGHPVVEVDEPGQRAFREEWLRAWPDGYSEPVIEQLLEHKRVVADGVGARFFLALVQGRPAAACELYVRAGTAQIEDVGTLERHRGRGLARAAVLRAVKEARGAGCDFVFLEAEQDDWPKELYRRLGFHAVGRTHVFRRKPAD